MLTEEFEFRKKFTILLTIHKCLIIVQIYKILRSQKYFLKYLITGRTLLLHHVFRVKEAGDAGQLVEHWHGMALGSVSSPT